MGMFTTYIALMLIEAGYSYWLGFAAALLTGLVMGAVIERVVIRPVEGKSEINAVILTLGLFIVIQSGAALIWGSTYPSFPAPFEIARAAWRERVCQPVSIQVVAVSLQKQPKYRQIEKN